MSIIHDALKKVQQSMQPNAQSAPAVPPPVSAPPQEPAAAQASNPMAENPWKVNTPTEVETFPTLASNSKKSNPWATAFWVLVSLIAITVSGYFIYNQIQHQYPRMLPRIHVNFSLKSLTKQLTRPAVLTSTPTPVVATKNTVETASSMSPTAPATAAKPASPAFSLQGIMASGGKHVALINNSVYEIGSVIDGHTVTKITLDTVTLEYNGKQEDLMLKK